MIIIPLNDAGTRHLMDREALARWTMRAQITIRRHCKPVGSDPATGSLLYDAEACWDLLSKVQRRRKQCEDGVFRAARA